MLLNDDKHPYKPSLFHLFFRWQRKMALWALFAGSVIATVDHFELLTGIFPSFPLAVVGGALGIFVSFRTNAAYQRWWEGRKLWGRMINTSRHICTQAITYMSAESAQAVVHRHVAYVHALRCGLRDQAPMEDARFTAALSPDERDKVDGATNTNHCLLNLQMRQFAALRAAGEITEFHLSDMDQSVRHLLDIQGGCERIKKTPFPPAYGFLASQLTQIYAVLFPLCVVGQLGWWVIPTNMVICMTFQLINEVGRVLENPFLEIWPALPLEAMSVTIERNLRQALGEDPLPPGVQAEAVPAGYVLM